MHSGAPRIIKIEYNNGWLFRALALTVLLFCGSNARPSVKTEYGIVRGIELRTYHGRRIFGFYNIPYSKPITPSQRFEEVGDPDLWSTLDAGGPAKKCPQLTSQNVLVGEDDCLVLNVFSPSLPNTSYSRRHYPVIVYIHGGAFYFLSGGINGPRYLLDHDVVLVTINYRIGVSGFGSTGDYILPGNLGLRDQIKALRWVQRNIGHFNGDKNSVTLIGMSAGAASVHLLYTSRKSRGLFHRGYLIGGTATQDWSLSKYPKADLSRIAEKIGCSSNSSFDMVFCLEQLKTKDLIYGTRQVQNKWLVPFCPVAPVVDNFAYDPVLPVLAYDVIEAGRAANIPLVMSNVQLEGLFPGGLIYNDSESIIDVNENWYSRAPDFLLLRDVVPQRFLNSTVKRIRQFYFGNQPIDKKSELTFLQMMSDRYHLTQAAKVSALQARTNPHVYYYIFDYKGGHSSSNSFTGHPEQFGASHVDDLFYLFNISDHIYLEENTTDLLMIQRMTSMLVSFATTGVPSFAPGVSFLPLSNRTSIYGPHRILYIKSPYDAEMKDVEGLGNVRFWEPLLKWRKSDL